MVHFSDSILKLYTPTMDKLFIKELKVSTVIGVYAWERQIKQTIILDLEYAANTQAAAEKDEISATCDYVKVGERLINFIEGTQFQLVETLAHRCADLLQQEFQMTWLKLTVQKTGVFKPAKSVGITVERSMPG